MKKMNKSTEMGCPNFPNAKDFSTYVMVLVLSMGLFCGSVYGNSPNLIWSNPAYESDSEGQNKTLNICGGTKVRFEIQPHPPEGDWTWTWDFGENSSPQTHEGDKPGWVTFSEVEEETQVTVSVMGTIKDGDDTFECGPDELVVTLRPNKVWSLTMVKNSAVTSVQGVTNNMQSSTSALQTDNDPHGDDDHRCCAKIVQSGAVGEHVDANFTTVKYDSEYNQVFSYLDTHNKHIYVTDTLTNIYNQTVLGRANGIGNGRFVVRANLGLNSTVVAHEWGHGIGLTHSDADNSNHIMWESAGANRTRVNTTVRDKFEGN